MKWDPDAVKDYTLSIYSPQPIDLYECYTPGTGSLETPAIVAVSQVVDQCAKLRKGRTYRHGDPLEDEYEGKTAKDLHEDLLSIEEHLL